MKRLVQINVYESKSVVVTQRIHIPNSDRLIIISQYTDVHDGLASLTIVSMPGMNYSIVMLGDTTISTIAYISKTILEDRPNVKSVTPETFWESYLVQHLCLKHGGQKQFYDNI